VSASNASGTGGVAYVAINWQSGAPVPSCTLSASNPTPPTGSTVTISASCTNSPTSYVWSGCASNGPNCTDSIAVAGTKEYTLVASNGAGAGNHGQRQRAVDRPGHRAAGVHDRRDEHDADGRPEHHAHRNLQRLADELRLDRSRVLDHVTDVRRDGHDRGIGNLLRRRHQLFRYRDAAAGIPVTWQPSGGGGGGGGDFCGSYPSVIRVQVDWGDYKRYTTGSLGGFDKDTVLVYSVVVPATPPSYSALGYTSLAEFQGDPAMRHMTLSKSACDFRPVDPTGANGPFEESFGKQVTIYWNVGAPPHTLEPGRTYHFSVRNRDYNGGTDCSSVCNAGISTIWPHN
jgi:hypothetical protein